MVARLRHSGQLINSHRAMVIPKLDFTFNLRLQAVSWRIILVSETPLSFKDTELSNERNLIWPTHTYTPNFFKRANI